MGIIDSAMKVSDFVKNNKAEFKGISKALMHEIAPQAVLIGGMELLSGKPLGEAVSSGLTQGALWGLFPHVMMPMMIGGSALSLYRAYNPYMEGLARGHNPYSYINGHMRTQEAAASRNIGMQIMSYHQRVGNMSSSGGLGMEAMMMHRSY